MRRRGRRVQNPEHVLRTETWLALPPEEAFAFFGEAENLQRITPPEMDFRIVTPRPIHMAPGAVIDYRLSLFRLPFTWRTEITEWDPPFAFVDTQLKGPYAQWIHRHAFRAEAGGTVIEDVVRYRLPVPVLGEIAWPLVRLQLRRIFRYRQRRIAELLGP
jgi:ligand-binding SRPBCC domain-containing protein